MIKPLRLSVISFLTLLSAFVFSFSVLQACVTLPGNPCDEPCKGEGACIHKYAKVIQTSCGGCGTEAETGSVEETAAHTGDVVINVSGMTCGGCENRVKKALSACKGVTDVHVSHKDGKAIVQIEEGKASPEELVEAVKKLGYSASEG